MFLCTAWHYSAGPQTWTFSSGKYLKFSDSSIFALICYLISGAPLQCSHTVRQSCLPACFILINSILPLLTSSFPLLYRYLVFKFPFKAELVSSSAEEFCHPLSEQSHVSQSLSMFYSQSFLECPSDNTILAWKLNKKLVWLTVWCLFRIRFISHDSVKWLILCSSVDSAHTVLNLAFFGQSCHWIICLSTFSPCEKYRHTI